ncbi:lytic transglycosylase domain-containing protein [Mesopusillimonas faecipullorum]|nr:lytic transglycosylase domain-containing protein [Mesopusillimonas faecipullorum]
MVDQRAGLSKMFGFQGQRYQKNGNLSYGWRYKVAGLVILAGLSGGVAAQAPLAASSEAVASAHEAMQKKQWEALRKLVPQAAAEPLVGAYPQFWLVRQQLRAGTTPVPQAQLQSYLDQWRDDAFLVDRLKGEWILASVRAGDYAQALQLAPVQYTNAPINCALLMARHMTGEKVSGEEAMSTFSPGGMCWSMLDEFLAKGVVGWSALQWELRAMLEANRTGDAQRMAALMFDAREMRDYAALMKAPEKWLAGQQPPKTLAQRELVAIALARTARGGQREASAEAFQKRWASHLPEADRQWVWAQMGLVAVLNGDNLAAQLYRRSGPDAKTDYNHAWEVRAELREPKIDWKRVEAAILKMSPRQQQETAWLYWRARALSALGKQEEARQLYVATSATDDFYGLLAREELGMALSLPPVPAPVSPAELAEAQANKGLQRAIRLFDLGARNEAVPVWAFTLRGMDDRQLRAAAELARQEHIYDRVINTSLLARNENDVSQRFVAPFEGRVSVKAKEVGLEPAWVYGLIRQESRFIMDARSRVGASGLMQLMPATAKWVARKIGMNDFTPSSVNDFDTNTILGTSYLSMVLNDLGGSQVLATAGYNAGPGRPVQWRARLAGPVEGAIFAETIPFTETRLYVKNVLANTVFYALKFTGEPQSLKARLGTIAPRPTRQVALP